MRAWCWPCHNQVICGAGGRSNLEDPYITLPEEEAGSDDEDDTLRDSDLLILAARNDDDVSHLEVRYRVETPSAAWPVPTLYSWL